MQRRAGYLAMRATAMRLLFTVLVVVCTPVAAQQTAFDTYEHVRDNVFWKHFYVCGGTTVYCGLPFAAGQKLLDGRKLTIEHAYPADWIATHHDCENRDTCKITAYGRAAADLHNLWPAIGNINSSRQDKPLAEIPGERHRRFEDYCPDFERTSRSGETEAIVEPRDSVTRAGKRHRTPDRHSRSSAGSLVPMGFLRNFDTHFGRSLTR